MAEPSPLSLGQLSVWHDIRELPPSRRHEPNNAAVWPLPPGVGPRQAATALRTMVERHPSLRTRYVLADPDAPRQLLPDEESDSGLPAFETDSRPQDVAAELATEPFDLGRQHGWRARLLTRGGAPSHVVFVKHHIAADAWAQELLHREFRQALTAPEALEPPPPGPADLAAEQYSPAGVRRQAAALDHWAQALTDTTPSVGLPSAGCGEDATVQCTLRSVPALSAARRIANRSGVSVSSVVLAAYARSVARVCHADTSLVQLMCANRFSRRWRNVVTSMNQWVPALIRRARDEDLVAVARAAHWSSLTAFRYGFHDVTAVEALRARTPQAPEPACAFNYVALAENSPGLGEATEDGTALTEPAIRWEEPFTTIGPRCYARALESGGALSIRLTVKDVARDQAAALLWDVHAGLLTTAERL